MSDRSFRIVHRQYFDKKALPYSEHWIVEEWRRGWFKEAWRPLKYTICSEGSCYKMTTEFKSQNDAQGCIERIIGGTPTGGWVRKVEQDVD